jgi:hypothetical protein
MPTIAANLLRQQAAAGEISGDLARAGVEDIEIFAGG